MTSHITGTSFAAIALESEDKSCNKQEQYRKEVINQVEQSRRNNLWECEK